MMFPNSFETMIYISSSAIRIKKKKRRKQTSHQLHMESWQGGLCFVSGKGLFKISGQLLRKLQILGELIWEHIFLPHPIEEQIITDYYLPVNHE